VGSIQHAAYRKTPLLYGVQRAAYSIHPVAGWVKGRKQKPAPDRFSAFLLAVTEEKRAAGGGACRGMPALTPAREGGSCPPLFFYLCPVGKAHMRCNSATGQ